MTTAALYGSDGVIHQIVSGTQAVVDGTALAMGLNALILDTDTDLTNLDATHVVVDGRLQLTEGASNA